jgi:hypothetical protein
MTREHGIIFSHDHNVRALLDGSKTQTRRELAVQPAPSGPCGLLGHPDLAGLFAPHVFGRCYAELAPSPYGKVGDRVWVREAFRAWDENHCDEHEDDGGPCAAHCYQTYVAYRATPRVGFRPVPDRAQITYLAESSPIEGDRRVNGPWKSPLFLPRDWSRITLEITELRVQRLHEITEEDARAEGVIVGEPVDMIVNGKPGKVTFFNARDAFAYLWAAINGPGSWKANPWVRALTFKRVEEARRG